VEFPLDIHWMISPPGAEEGNAVRAIIAAARYKFDLILKQQMEKDIKEKLF